MAMAWFFGATLGATSAPPAAVITPGGLAEGSSSNDFVLSFSSARPNLYTVQAAPDFLHPWTNLPPGIQGDGTVKTVTITNGVLGSQGFYRLLIQSPASLILPQSLAFTYLGHSCGGIDEQVYVTGFDGNGYPTGQATLSTSCGGSGKDGGGHSTTYTAAAAVTWDFAGNVIFSALLTNSVADSPTFLAADSYGDTIYNASGLAYLVVPVPGAPTGVDAVQSGDEFDVSWTFNGANPAAVISSTLTATPLGSASPVLTATVTGGAASGVIPTLQPQTTYQVTVVNTTASGAGPASAPITVTTVPPSVPPSVPTGVTASWQVADPSGDTDTLVASWQAADPGNSPVDEYQITITGSDGVGTMTQTVSGTTLTAYFSINDVPNWSVTVQAHNAAGWGPVSSAVQLGGL